MNCAVSGVAQNGKQGKCLYTCHFRGAKMLVGVPPNPLGTSGHTGQKYPIVCGLSLSLLGLIFPPTKTEMLVSVERIKGGT